MPPSLSLKRLMQQMKRARARDVALNLAQVSRESSRCPAALLPVSSLRDDSDLSSTMALFTVTSCHPPLYADPPWPQGEDETSPPQKMPTATSIAKANGWKTCTQIVTHGKRHGHAAYLLFGRTVLVA